MKTLGIALSILITASLLTACQDNRKQAEALLLRAEQAYAMLDLEGAETKVDSLKAIYMKEYEVLRKALTLSRRIEVVQQQRNIAYADSMITTLMPELEAITRRSFTFEQGEYSSEGIFFHRTQRGEESAQRCYLRATVSRGGNFLLASVYYGANPIKHTAVRVSVDGNEATSQSVAYDGAANYRFKDDNSGAHTEVLSLNAEQENGIMTTILSSPKAKVEVTLLGGTPLRYTLRDDARKALSETYELGTLLSKLNTFEKEWERSKNRLAYLQAKLKGDPVGHNELPTKVPTINPDSAPISHSLTEE